MHTPLQASLQPKNQSDASQRKATRTIAQRRALVDNRPEVVAQRKLAEMMDNSARVRQQQALNDAIHNSPQMVAQRHKINALFGGTVQLQVQEHGAMPAPLSPVHYAQGNAIHVAYLPGQRTIDYPLRDSLTTGGIHQMHPQTSGNSVQRKIIHPTDWFPADKPEVMEYDAVEGVNSVTLDVLTKTSKPEEVEEMDDPEIHKTIMDPSRKNKQRLTKMHLIRGRFGAPGEVENLRLGTALSNNFDDDSHYAQVEKPIADFLNGAKGKRMVEYQVAPFGSPPAYFNERLKKHPTAAAFVSEMCPQSFVCAVRFAETNDNVNWFWSPQQIEHVRLDNKFENGGDEVP